MSDDSGVSSADSFTDIGPCWTKHDSVYSCYATRCPFGPNRTSTNLHQNLTSTQLNLFLGYINIFINILSATCIISFQHPTFGLTRSLGLSPSGIQAAFARAVSTGRRIAEGTARGRCITSGSGCMSCHVRADVGIHLDL